MKDLFIGFLKDNDVYDKFINNLSIQNNGLDIDTYFKYEEEDYLLESIFYDAFTWAITEDCENGGDSHEYWLNLSDKWEDVLKQQKNETKN